jgi:hypothetical protein
MKHHGGFWARCIVLCFLALAPVLAAAPGCGTRSANRTIADSGTPARPPAAAANPKTEEACARCNGVWGIHGLARSPSCSCRTADEGRRCRDGNDCQGQCVAADPPEREVVASGPPARGYYVGRCSQFTVVVGCRFFISRGAAASGPVDLSTPLRKLCID